MQQIKIQMSGADAAPRTTEASLYPNIDANYTAINYEGQRLIARNKQVFGIRQFNTMASSMQGFAVYGNLAVRMSANTTHYIYTISEQGFTQVATFTGDGGHSNSLQFAPSVESGNAFPYLYVANLPNICSVWQIAANYSVTKVQTITIASGVVEGGNVQIGEDGYIWYCGCANDGSWRVVKFRRVLVSEGDVTLSANDILDDWTTAEKWPYSQYTFQGAKFKRGQYWQLYGLANSTALRGLVVYDTATHSIVAAVDFSGYANFEPEDLDFWDNSVLVCTLDANVYQLQF